MVTNRQNHNGLADKTILRARNCSKPVSKISTPKIKQLTLKKQRLAIVKVGKKIHCCILTNNEETKWSL